MPEIVLAGPFVALVAAAALALGVALSARDTRPVAHRRAKLATIILLSMAVAWPLLLFLAAPVGPD